MKQVVAKLQFLEESCKPSVDEESKNMDYRFEEGNEKNPDKTDGKP